MAKKIGDLIKEARTEAGLTQEQLAKKITGVTASDISKAERGEKEFSQAVLKEIAKATGVTQASLLDAAKKSTKTSGKTSSTAAKTGTAAKSTASKSSMQVTAAEKKLIELYRAADVDTKKNALKVLKGEKDTAEDILTTLIGSAANLLGKK